MVCKFYDGGVVKVGTAAVSRFTIKVPPDEMPWFSTRLRMELVNRELASAAELPVDETGEAAMAAKMAATEREAAKRAAWKQAKADGAADPKRRAAAALESAEHSERIAGHKRALAEEKLKLAQGLSDFKRTAPTACDAMGKAAKLVTELAAKAAPEAHGKLEAMTETVERAQSSRSKLEAYWGRVEVRTQYSSRKCARLTSASDLLSVTCGPSLHVHRPTSRSHTVLSRIQKS